MSKPEIDAKSPELSDEQIKSAFRDWLNDSDNEACMCVGDCVGDPETMKWMESAWLEATHRALRASASAAAPTDDEKGLQAELDANAIRLRAARSAASAAAPQEPVAWIDPERLKVMKEDSIGAFAYQCWLAVHTPDHMQNRTVPLYLHPPVEAAAPLTKPASPALCPNRTTKHHYVKRKCQYCGMPHPEVIEKDISENADYLEDGPL